MLLIDGYYRAVVSACTSTRPKHTCTRGEQTKQTNDQITSPCPANRDIPERPGADQKLFMHSAIRTHHISSAAILHLPACSCASPQKLERLPQLSILKVGAHTNGKLQIE